MKKLVLNVGSVEVEAARYDQVYVTLADVDEDELIDELCREGKDTIQQWSNELLDIIGEEAAKEYFGLVNEE